MEIIREVNDFWTLKANSWSGALNTLKNIEDACKEDEFMMLLEEVFACGNTPTETEVNDFIWFERDFIYESLGLDENGELPKEDDEEKENDRNREKRTFGNVYKR